MSNINICSPGGYHVDTVGVYDSVRPHSIGLLKKMVCSFFKCTSDTIHFTLVNVETQPNSYDCGVISIANAAELVFGGDPAIRRWDYSRIREHLKDCLEKGVMKRFPTVGKRRVVCKPSHAVDVL